MVPSTQIRYQNRRTATVHFQRITLFVIPSAHPKKLPCGSRFDHQHGMNLPVGGVPIEHGTAWCKSVESQRYRSRDMDNEIRILAD